MVARTDVFERHIIVELRIQARETAASEAGIILIGKRLAGHVVACNTAAVGKGSDEQRIDVCWVLENIKRLIDAVIEK